MSRRQKFGLAAAVCVFAFILAGVASMVPSWAGDNQGQQVHRQTMNWGSARHMRARYPSLLMSQRLRNDSTAHYLHVHQTLKAITPADLGMFGPAAGLVNFRKGWHPRPFTSQPEDNAIFKLGVMAGLGHFCVVNANIPELKDHAVTIVGNLTRIASETSLNDMVPELNQISQALSDPGFTGGPCKTLECYDAFVSRLADRVLDVYILDGFWYYTAGVTLAGLNSVPGLDKYNAPYFRDMLQELYNYRPSQDVPYAARYEMAKILRSDYVHYNSQVDQDRAQRAILAMYKM